MITMNMLTKTLKNPQTADGLHCAPYWISACVCVCISAYSPTVQILEVCVTAVRLQGYHSSLGFMVSICTYTRIPELNCATDGLSGCQVIVLRTHYTLIIVGKVESACACKFQREDLHFGVSLRLNIRYKWFGVVCSTQMNESHCKSYRKITAPTCASAAATSPDSLILAYRGTDSISLVKSVA